MTINDLASKFSITSNKLRFYEKKGLLVPKRDTNNYRVYTVDDMIKLQAILTYRAIEMPIEDIKRVLSKRGGLDHELFKQLTLVNNAMHKYRIIQDALESVLDAYLMGDPTSEIEENLIEAGRHISHQLSLQSSWQDRWDFDNWADTYDQSIRRPGGVLEFYKNYDQVLRTVYKLAGQGRSPGKVLDIGCGTGNLGGLFLEGGYQVVGLDQSINMLITCKKKYPQMLLRQGEFLKLPFEAGSFDTLVTTYAFHHLKEEEKVLALLEMKRVLKEGGRLIIGDLMFLDQGAKDNFCKGLEPEGLEEVDDEYYSHIDLLETYVKSMGMTLTYEPVDDLIYLVTIQ